MKVTICTNIETLAPIWEDIFESAGLEMMSDWNEEIGNAWASHVSEALSDIGIDWEYESSFQYWHGGPGHGTYKFQYDDPRVSEIISSADSHARAMAERTAYDLNNTGDVYEP